MNYTEQLAKFLAAMSYGALPSSVAWKAKFCILDYVANVYGSLELDAVAKIADLIRSLDGKPSATVLGCGFQADIHSAVFMNGG